MNRKIELPIDLRERIIADQARLKSHRAGEGQTLTALQTQIKSLEETQAVLTQRVAALTFQAISSDIAAGELSSVERRAAAVRTHLDALRSTPLPAIDLEATYGVLFSIVFFYQEAVQNLFLSDLEPWGVDIHHVRITLGQVPALSALTNVSNWLSTGPAPHSHNLTRISVIYDRALRGQVDLSSHEDRTPDPSLP